MQCLLRSTESVAELTVESRTSRGIIDKAAAEAVRHSSAACTTAVVCHFGAHDLCVDTCLDMDVGVRVDMHADVCADMRLDMCLYMCTHVEHGTTLRRSAAKGIEKCV